MITRIAASTDTRPATPGTSGADELIDEGLELLDEAEARALLTSGRVGRIGITIGGVPAIFPVNYGMVGGAIVFRTAPGSKLAAAADGAVVAFEVDDYDVADRTGWSVLAIGPCEIVDDVDLMLTVLGAGVEPWAGGVRTNIVRIRTDFVSGRRIA